MCIWQIHSQPLTASSCLGNSALSVHVLLFPRWQYGLCANLTCGLLPRRKLTFALHKTILNVNFYTDMFYVSRGVMRWPASAAEQNSWSWIMVNDILDWRFALLKTLFCSTPSFMSQLLSDIVPSSVWYPRLLTVSLHTVKRFQAHSKNHLFNEYYREYHNLFEKKHTMF